MSSTHQVTNLADITGVTNITLNSNGIPGFSTAAATALGQKQYVAGTTYANGTPTVTGTNWTTVRALFIPYQDVGGAWRMRLNVGGTVSGAPTSITITLTGITFKNVSLFVQALAPFTDGGNNISTAWANPNASTIQIVNSGGIGSGTFGASGDVELNAKPTWAD